MPTQLHVENTAIEDPQQSSRFMDPYFKRDRAGLYVEHQCLVVDPFAVVKLKSMSARREVQVPGERNRWRYCRLRDGISDLRAVHAEFNVSRGNRRVEND